MITRLYTLFLAPNDRAKARLGGYIAAGPPPPPCWAIPIRPGGQTRGGGYEFSWPLFYSL